MVNYPRSCYYVCFSEETSATSAVTLPLEHILLGDTPSSPRDHGLAGESRTQPIFTQEIQAALRKGEIQ